MAHEGSIRPNPSDTSPAGPPWTAANGPRIQHLVVTRFNLRLRSMTTDKRGRDVLTEDWLRNRVDLFERYCLPSVIHQTERRFTWLLLMDEATDSSTVDRVQGGLAPVDDADLVFLPTITRRGQIPRAIAGRVRDDIDILLTTRLDNDDALHEEALAMVREQVTDRREFLNLRIGFVTDGTQAVVRALDDGPFVTFVEPQGERPWQTVFCERHPRLRRVAPVRQVGDRPLWLRVVHDRNIANLTFAERRRLEVTSLSGVGRWIRRIAADLLEPRLLPAHYRGQFRLEKIAAPFHIGE